MKSALLAIVVMSSCVGCAAGLRFTANVRTISQQRAAVVRLQVRCSNPGGGGQASGVIISPREILTASHVVNDCVAPMQIIASEPSGFGHYMRVVLDVPGADLARFAIIGEGEFSTSPRFRVARVAPRDVVCVATGEPKEDYRCGIVEAISNAPAADIWLSIPIEPGNSGSPLYDERGRVVGIVTNMRTLKREKQVSGGLATALAGRGWALDQVSLLRSVR